jgi:hypothetical protein
MSSREKRMKTSYHLLLSLHAGVQRIPPQRQMLRRERRDEISKDKQHTYVAK